MLPVTRRSWLRLAGFGSAAAATLFGARRISGQQNAVGRTARWNTRPTRWARSVASRPKRSTRSSYLRAWNFSDLPPEERARYYHETPRPDGTLLREYQIFAVDREIEIAPGVFFPAWTFNGQVPGPTIRATEGDRVRVTFLNQGSHPHTIHFHGWHPPEMDGSLPEHQVMPGERFVYEFDAEPFGLHLYHCHAVPLKRHIHKGLYGVFIVDPQAAAPPADELVMVMNGFDTNFDADNEVYAVNTRREPLHARADHGRGRQAGAHLPRQPHRVRPGQQPPPARHVLRRVPHRHARRRPPRRTDTVMLCQGERAILETRFRYPGKFMFHAHQSEFAELGWMGLFEAVGVRRDT